MLKKMTVVLFFLLLTVSYGLGVCSAEDKVYKFRMQSYYPQTIIYAHENYAKTVEKMSNGRIKISVFAGGELTASANIVKAVKSGMVDMAVGNGNYFTEISLGTIESGLPMAWQNAVEARLFYEGLGFKQLLAKEYEKNGVHYLASVPVAPYNILTKKPAASIEDLKKMKIRAIGGSAKMLNSLGVATVNLPSEDIYLGLTTGQVDGVLYGGAQDYKVLKFYESAKYYNTTPITDPIMDSFLINPKIWNSLPADLQEILVVAANQAGWDYYDGVVKEEYSVREEIFDGTTSFSSEDVATLSTAAVAVWDDAAKKSPECAEAVEMIKTLNRLVGRLK